MDFTKNRFLALALSFLFVFTCGCASDKENITGDVYTDFSDNDTADFSSNLTTNENSKEFESSSNNNKAQESNNISQSSANSKNYKNNFSSDKNNSSKNEFTQSASVKTSTQKSNSTSSEKPLKLSTINITNSNKSAFKTIGRCDTGSSKGLALSWGGSSVEFSLLCEGKISLDFSFENSTLPVYIRIELDGKSTKSNRIEVSASGNITLNSNLRGTHTIKILRLSNAEAAPLILNSISTYGELIKTPPQNKPIYIEAIGANNFCGQGLLLSASDDNYTQNKISNPAFADITLTYPYIASQKLNADCYILAKKGSGFAATNLLQKQDYNGTIQKISNPSGLLPNIYKLINLHSDKEYIQTRNPDIIVIDAGMADSQPELLKHAYFNGKLGISKAQAISIAAEFLNSLKSQNPNLKIIWCYGMTSTNSDYLNFVESVVQKTLNSSDYVYTLKLPKAARTDFPTALEHSIAANLLGNKIKNILQLKSVS